MNKHRMKTLLRACASPVGSVLSNGRPRLLCFLLTSLVFAEASAVAPPNTPRYITDLAVGPDGSLLLFPNSGRLYYSRNRGDSWKPVTPVHSGWTEHSRDGRKEMGASLRDEAFSWWVPAPGPKTDGGNGAHYSCVTELYRSLNRGLLWEKVSDLPKSPHPPVYCRAIGFSEGLLYVAEGVGLYGSRDGGLNWFPIKAAEADLGSLAVTDIFPAPGGVLLNLLDSPSGSSPYFYESKGGGRRIRFGGFAGRKGETPKLVGVVNGVMYAAVAGMMIESRDSGASWRRVPLVLEPEDDAGPVAGATVIGIRASGNGDLLYAVTPRHVYRKARGSRAWERAAGKGLRLGNCVDHCE